MPRFLLIILMFFASNSYGFAQALDSAKKRKIYFRSINQLGVIIGAQKDPAMQLQTINGVQVKKMFLGVGAGVDYYAEKSIPIFADLRTPLPFSNHSFFVYGDAGINFPWDKDEKDDWMMYEYKKGLYYDIGAGYSVKATRRSAFVISAGYSRKESKQKATSYWMNGGETVYGQAYDFSYQQRRFVLKLGWMF